MWQGILPPEIFPADQGKLLNCLTVCALLVSLVCPLSANAIIGGQVDPNTASSPWAGVGSLSVKGGTYTATAIGPRFILTAAHVVEGVSAKSVNFNLNAGSKLSQSIKASAIHVYPAYHGFTPSAADGLVHNDIAVIELSADLPPGVPIYSLLTDLPVAPPTITLVGYGKSGDGVSGATISGSAQVKRVGENQVDSLSPGQSGKPEMYMFDFDGPASATNTMGGSALEHEAQLGSGDSGSPAFVRANGVMQILGVNTYVGTTLTGHDNSKFGALGGGALVSAYAGWIHGVVAAPRADIATPQAAITAAVPEPTEIGMLLSGAVVLLWAVRRRRKAIQVGE